MSDKDINEFWKSLFDEDFPDPRNEAEETGFWENAELPDEAEDGAGAQEQERMGAASAPGEPAENRQPPEAGHFSDTNVLPSLNDLEIPGRGGVIPFAQPADGEDDEDGEDGEAFVSSARARKMARARERYDRRARRLEEESLREQNAYLRADEEAEEDGDEPYERPISRARNKRSGCLGAILYFIFVVGLSLLLALLGWIAISDVLALGREDKVVEFTVPEDFTIDEVVKELKADGLIKYDFLFKIFAAYSHAADNIDPGTYELNLNYDYRALIAYMQSSGGAQVTTTVSIPEGYTTEQIFDALEAAGICGASELEDAAANYAFDYDFLEDAAPGDANRLEGFLFPDTYEFYVNAAAAQTLDKFLRNFDGKLTEEMRAKADALGLSPRQIVTVAALIEKETDGTDRSKIASVIYNRLNNPDYETAGFLQIDASLYYALGKSMSKSLTSEDFQTDSPYNTYKYKGLPPGPIANPGMESIEAALEPGETDYYYYALDKDGLHHYSRTLSEQNAFLASLGQ